MHLLDDAYLSSPDLHRPSEPPAHHNWQGVRAGLLCHTCHAGLQAVLGAGLLCQWLLASGLCCCGQKWNMKSNCN